MTAAGKAIVLGSAGRAVGENVRRLRKAQGLTGDALAQRLTHLGRPFKLDKISMIERHRRRVDADDLAALAIALGVRPDQLLEPWICDVCHGKPPVGFACRTCGAGGGEA